MESSRQVPTIVEMIKQTDTSMESKSTQIIQSLDLIPHPEGGFYKETYRSDEKVEIDGKTKSASTAIYYLLESGDFSGFHRISHDELWHFYEGDPVIIHQFYQGKYEVLKVGDGEMSGHKPQVVVPGGAWFASELAPGGEYCLAGCTVAPGFDFDDFELAKRDELIAEFPDHKELITRLTRQ